MSDFQSRETYRFEDLVGIMRRLRGPGGCPWDAVQTHESIKKNLIEETYEVIEAIHKRDRDLLCEELGDLLMQVVFHAQMEEDAGSFTVDDVADGVCKKLIERHPHVFGDITVTGVDNVLSNWDAIKRGKKGQKAGSAPMRSVPRELPALMRSSKVQQKAAAVGFDWPDIQGALDKLKEELRELEAALAENRQAQAWEELGDILFSAVNVSRFLQRGSQSQDGSASLYDAEEALTAACDKFIARFIRVEQLAEQRGLDMQTAGIDALDKLWDEAKALSTDDNTMNT